MSCTSIWNTHRNWNVFLCDVLSPYFTLCPLPRHFRDESEKFLCDVLLPNLVWRAGRSAAAVRTSALSCLLALLHGGAIAPGQVHTQRTCANINMTHMGYICFHLCNAKGPMSIGTQYTKGLQKNALQSAETLSLTQLQRHSFNPQGVDIYFKFSVLSISHENRCSHLAISESISSAIFLPLAEGVGRGR